MELEENKFLHFSVVDVNSKEDLQFTKEDGIVFTLEQKDNVTTLNIKQGDFSKMHDGEKYFNATVEVWKKVLPEIKELSEKL